MKTNNPAIKRILLTATAWSVWGALAVLARLPPPPTPTAPPTQAPLDGGVLLLSAAGAAYGAGKLYKRQKVKK